jgi:hypothetical protein
MSKGYAIDGGQLGEIMVNVCGCHLMRFVGKLLYNRRLSVCAYCLERKKRNTKRYRSE